MPIGCQTKHDSRIVFATLGYCFVGNLLQHRYRKIVLGQNSDDKIGKRLFIFGSFDIVFWWVVALVDHAIQRCKISNRIWERTRIYVVVLYAQNNNIKTSSFPNPI